MKFEYLARFYGTLAGGGAVAFGTLWGDGRIEFSEDVDS